MNYLHILLMLLIWQSQSYPIHRRMKKAITFCVVTASDGATLCPLGVQMLTCTIGQNKDPNQICQKEFPVEKMDEAEDKKKIDCTSSIPVKKMEVPGLDDKPAEKKGMKLKLKKVQADYRH